MGSGCKFGTWKASNHHLWSLVFSGCQFLPFIYTLFLLKYSCLGNLGPPFGVQQSMCVYCGFLQSGQHLRGLPSFTVKPSFQGISEHRLCLGRMAADLSSVDLGGKNRGVCASQKLAGDPQTRRKALLWSFKYPGGVMAEV